MARFDMIAFDADDTLWQTEQLYVAAQTTFKELLSQYHAPEWIEARLYEAEMRNLQHFGYGIKAFALSMIETAVELTEGRITGKDIQTLIDLAKSMLLADIELLEYVADTLAHLAEHYPLMIITKGDLRDQEGKIARSGLSHYFHHIEIVSDKSSQNYSHIMKRYNISPERFVMVGNSLRSDILPVLALGACAIYVPHPLTWAHEAAEPPTKDQAGFYEIDHVGRLPDLLAALER